MMDGFDGWSKASVVEEVREVNISFLELDLEEILAEQNASSACLSRSFVV